MSIFHLTISVRGRRALARDELERRVLVRAIARPGRGLLLFCLVDDHLHAVVRVARPRYLARDIRRAVRALRPDLELKPPHLEPVDSRPYLLRLVAYVMRQPEKHGLATAPALWTGSCFQDLVRARVLPGFDPRQLAAELPRLRLREVFEGVGLEPRPLVASGDEALRRAGAARLVDLATGVYAVDPELRGHTKPVVSARILAARIASTVGVPRGEVARFLGVSPQAVGRLAKRVVEPRALDALRRRLTLEERSARTG